MGDKKELLEYLLGEGARVEMTGGPILLRAKMCGASEEIRELLVRYGPTTDLDLADEELAEEGGKSEQQRNNKGEGD